ncbi:uncharacterized protein ARMOST_17044 [Armillaria ostoyae]|uniref:Uncharacterized protein n=1 Tax=Armillaria ostoyae TaxID=47428 RepID=A0A284RXW4_ARMOS|nr:uncharacterized protein ARMOST_17044 [Armillaria ostoyae]
MDVCLRAKVGGNAAGVLQVSFVTKTRRRVNGHRYEVRLFLRKRRYRRNSGNFPTSLVINEEVLKMAGPDAIHRGVHQEYFSLNAVAPLTSCCSAALYKPRPEKSGTDFDLAGDQSHYNVEVILATTYRASFSRPSCGLVRSTPASPNRPSSSGSRDCLRGDANISGSAPTRLSDVIQCRASQVFKAAVHSYSNPLLWDYF